MTLIIPAIDLIGGRCVRLTQGDFSRQSTYASLPLEMALQFRKAGIRRIHVVDLDGAKAGCPMNLEVLKELASGTDLDIEWGGGIQSERDIEAALEAGAGHIVCGTLAVRDPERFLRWSASYGCLVLGADVRGMQVATHGWLRNSGKDIFGLLEAFPSIREAIVTQIARDGTFKGPDIPLYLQLGERFPDLILTASGGIGSMDDLRALDDAGIPRAIVGKAIYENRISLEDIALWSANESSPASM